MNDAKTERLPLHTTVEVAIEGDAGWMWWEGEWRLAKIIHDVNDDVLYAAVIINDECRPFEFGEIEDLPWMPIHRPPYEGDEKPCTHAVTIMDQQSSMTFSWDMSVSDGRKAVQRVTNAIDAMLREGDAAEMVK